MIAALHFVIAGLLLLDNKPAGNQVVMLVEQGASSPVEIVRTDSSGHFRLERSSDSGKSCSLMACVENDSCRALYFLPLRSVDTTVEINCTTASLVRQELHFKAEPALPPMLNISIKADSIDHIPSWALKASHYTGKQSLKVFFKDAWNPKGDPVVLYLPPGTYRIRAYTQPPGSLARISYMQRFETRQVESTNHQLNESPRGWFLFALPVDNRLLFSVKPIMKQ